MPSHSSPHGTVLLFYLGRFRKTEQKSSYFSYTLYQNPLRLVVFQSLKFVQLIPRIDSSFSIPFLSENCSHKSSTPNPSNCYSLWNKHSTSLKRLNLETHGKMQDHRLKLQCQRTTVENNRLVTGTISVFFSFLVDHDMQTDLAHT